MSNSATNNGLAIQAVEEFQRLYGDLDKVIADKISDAIDKRTREAEAKERTLLTPDTFLNWFHNLTTRAKGLYSVALAVPGLTAVAGLMAKTIQPAQAVAALPPKEWFLLGVLFLQSFAVFMLYWLIPSRRIRVSKVVRDVGRTDEGGDEKAKVDSQHKIYCKANNIAGKFSRMWQYAWLSWAILYFAWSCVVFEGLMSGVKVGDALMRWSPLTGFLNNLSTVFLIMCYRELSFPTKRGGKDQQLPIFTMLVIIGFAAVIELVSVREGATQLLGVTSRWVGSFTAGAVIALLTGRLESKLINPPLPIIVMLYLYAAIQATVVIFPKDAELMIAITGAALVFKVVLFLLVAWLLESGVMTFYLAQMNQLYKETSVKRETFVKAVQGEKLA